MFKLTEEQQMVRDTARRIAQEKVAPRAAAIDREDKYPWDLLEIFKEQGFMGIPIAKEYGGGGLGLFTMVLVIEELAKVSATAALVAASQDLGMMPLYLSGSEEQKQKYLPDVARGEIIMAFGLTEPEAGSDAASLKTLAERKGDRYILNGRKCFITNGGIADLYSIFAVTNPERGVRGISCFLVPKDTPGFIYGKREDKMGIRGTEVRELIFDNCAIPAENLLGKEGQGFKTAMMTLDRTRPAVGAQALGIAQGALDIAVEYTRQRKQFGKPIATLQGIQFMLADMATQVEAARQLVYTAARMVDEAEAENGADIKNKELSRISSMSKLAASDAAMRVTTDAVQLLGGYGYMKDYPLERMMRDAKITQIYEGTNQIQRLVIAGSLF